MDRKRSFLLYKDYMPSVETLSDEEAGKLIKSIFRYVNNETLVEQMGEGAGMLFNIIQTQIDRDTTKYEAVCKKRSESIKARWANQSEHNNISDDLESKLPFTPELNY